MKPEFADDLRSWLIEPDFASTQRQPLTLDAQQRKFATERTVSGFRLIKGPAGSGKSMVLAARAAQLSAAGKDVLVVTFNQTLWHYLRDLAVRYPISGRRLNKHVTWCHFHERCKQVCIKAGMEDAYHKLWSQYDDNEVLQHRLPDLANTSLLATNCVVPQVCYTSCLSGAGGVGWCCGCAT